MSAICIGQDIQWRGFDLSYIHVIPYIVYILSYVYFWVQKHLQIFCTHAVCKESAEIQEIQENTRKIQAISSCSRNKIVLFLLLYIPKPNADNGQRSFMAFVVFEQLHNFWLWQNLAIVCLGY